MRVIGEHIDALYRDVIEIDNELTARRERREARRAREVGRNGDNDRDSGSPKLPVLVKMSASNRGRSILRCDVC